MMRNATLSTAALGEQSLAKSALLVVAGSVLLTLSSKISVPFFPVPMTMQTFTVLLLGFALGARLGLVTVLAWLAQGAAGLPVFAGPAAGLAYFAGPTGGYLAGFALAAWATGALAERGWDRSLAGSAAAALLGLAVIYAAGLGWLGTVVGWDKPVLELGLIPFLPGELAKLGLLACALPLAWRALGRGDS